MISADANANVKVKKFNQARVNGGSNYDYVKVAKCLAIYLVTRINGLMRFPLSLSSSIPQNHSQGNGLHRSKSAGKEDHIELDSGPTL